MAENLGELYIRMGLSLSELETDFLSAERTVTDNVRRLNRQSELLKIRAQVEMEGLDKVADAERILQIRQETLNQQMAIQRDRVRILDAELGELSRTQGENSIATQRATLRIERERLALARLEREIREVTASISELNSTDINVSGTASISGGSGGSGGGASSGSGSWSDLLPFEPPTTKVAAFGLAIGALGATISKTTDIINEALDDFRETEKQAYELNIDFNDAEQFLRELKLGGGDIGDFEGYIHGITDAYVKGEYDDPEFVALRKYGAQITDETGRLKNFKDLTEEVYQAWKKADEAGEGIEFLQLTGGEAGVRDAIQFFKRYEEAKEDAAKIVDANLDQEQWHELERSLNLAEEQADELKEAIANIFTPAVQSGAEKFFETLRDGTDWLIESREELQRFGFVAAEVFDELAPLLKNFSPSEQLKSIVENLSDIYSDISNAKVDFGDEKVNNALKSLESSAEEFYSDSLTRKAYEKFFGDLANTDNPISRIFEHAAEAQRKYNGELEETNSVSGKVAQGLAALSEAQKKNGDALSQYGTQRVKKFKDELADLRVELEFSGDEYRKALAQQDLWLQRELSDKNFVSPAEKSAILALDAIKRQLIDKEHFDKIAEAIQTNLDNAADIEYEMTHSAFEKQLHDIELWEEAQRQKAETAEEISAIIAESAAKEAQAFEDEMERIKGKLQSLDDKIFDIDHSQYEKDLRRIQQDYFKQAQEYQDMGAFTPEVKAKLDYLYIRQKQDLDKRANESRTKGGDYTKTPEGSYGGGMPIGLFADTSGIEALLYSKLDADAQREVNKIRGTEDLVPVQQEFQQFGETVQQTVDDLQSFEDLKNSLKDTADTQKTLDDRIKILTESTSKLAQAQNDFIGTLKNLSPADSPQLKGVTSEKSTFAKKVKESALKISEKPTNAESGVLKDSDPTQKVSGAQYYRFPISTDINRYLRETLGVALPDITPRKGVFSTLKAMPAELPALQMPEPSATLVDYLTPLNNIDGKLQSILQATQTQETISFETVVTPLNSINTLVGNILTALSNRQPPQINISPNNSIDLGGAYVFDNALKQELVNDITSRIVDEITTAVRQATSQSSYGFSA